MGRDDSESVVSDCNRFGIENISPSNVGGYKDLSQDQRNRLHQSSIINSNQISNEEHSINRYRMMVLILYTKIFIFR